MGKTERRLFSIKKIWNIRGKDKLKFYCQMCEKQCRDAKGFKCHCDSPSHNKMMELYLQHEDEFVEKFSKEFQKSFLECLKRHFGSKKVLASIAYNELINDNANHIHLNSTRWETLEDFISQLGKSSICLVEDSPKGLMVQFIERDQNILRKQQELLHQKQQKVSDDELKMKILERQIAAIKEMEKEEEKQQQQQQQLEEQKEVQKEFASNFNPNNVMDEESIDLEVEQCISFSLKTPNLGASHHKETDILTLNPSKALHPPTSLDPFGIPTLKKRKIDQEVDLESTKAVDDDDVKGSSDRSKHIFNNDVPKIHYSTPFMEHATGLSNLTEIIKLEEKKKAALNTKDYWLQQGILVRCLHEKLEDGKYYRKKGKVIGVIDHYICQLEMLDTGDILQLKQKYLETVIPSVIGAKVLIVNGPYVGEECTLLSLDEENCTGNLKSTLLNQTFKNVPFEHFSKLA